MKHNSSQPHIALIDSGIGGLSILDCLEQQICSPNISYFMDSLFLPYGELAQAQLLSRLQAIVKFLQLTQPDIVVIACNTASVQSLDFLRQQFQLPFVGVVPAIKPAAKKTKSGRIGLLATPATVNGVYTQRLIEQFAGDCQVVSYGSSQLVRLAEHCFWQLSGEEPQIEDFSLFNQVDTLVLGCTHFPLIAERIAQLLPEGVELVDSGQAIAKRVCQLLADDCIRQQSRQFKQLFCSATLSSKQQLRLKQLGFDAIELVEI